MTLDDIEEERKRDSEWITCKCGKVYPTSDIAIMKDYTYRPPKISKVCRHCQTVLEEIDRVDVHEDIIEGIIQKKFKYTVTIKDVNAITRFERMLDASTEKGTIVVSGLDVKFNREEKVFIATFVSNSDKWQFEKVPKTVKYFKFAEL